MKKITLLYATLLITIQSAWYMEASDCSEDKINPVEITVENGMYITLQFVKKTPLLVTSISKCSSPQIYYGLYKSHTGEHVRDLTTDYSLLDGTPSDDGTQYLCTSNNPMQNPLFDIETGQVVTTYEGEKEDNYINQFFSPDGNEIWLQKWNRELVRIDKNTGKKIAIYKKSGTKLSPDRTIGILQHEPSNETDPTSFTVYNIIEQRELGSFEVPGHAFIASLNPDDKTCCVGYISGRFDLPTKEVNIKTYDGQKIVNYDAESGIGYSAYSIDGNTLGIGIVGELQLINPKT